MKTTRRQRTNFGSLTHVGQKQAIFSYGKSRPFRSILMADTRYTIVILHLDAVKDVVYHGNVVLTLMLCKIRTSPASACGNHSLKFP